MICHNWAKQKCTACCGCSRSLAKPRRPAQRAGHRRIRLAWQAKLAALPQNAQVTLRQALATVAAKTPSAKVDEAMLLKLAEDLAIRFALDRFQRGEVRVNAVRQMLDKMGHELGTLRKAAEGARRKNGQRGNVGGIARGRARPAVLGRGAGIGQARGAHVHGSVVHSAAQRAAICGRTSWAAANRMPPETCC